MPSLSNIGNTAVALNSSDNTVRPYGIWIKADAGNPNTVYCGLANTVTAGLANLICTTGAATDGYPLPNTAGTSDFLITKAECDRVGVTCCPANVYVITLGPNGNRVYFQGQ